jgi:Helix-turn-helix domain
MTKILRAHDLETTRLLTLAEAAQELRCSKAHLYNVLSGKVKGLPPLPVFHIGRKAFIRHPQLQAWIRTLEDIERENRYATGDFGLRDEEWESIAGA